ncbi:MAG: hypothetical protein ACOVOV_02480 [Dolichospermum sp.]
MIKENKYATNPINQVGFPILLDLSAVSSTERLLITLKEGATTINSIPMIADYASGYECKVNQALIDYIPPIGMPDVGTWGASKVDGFIHTITPHYHPISNTNDVVLDSFLVSNSKVPSYLSSQLEQSFFDKIGFLTLNSPTVISYRDEQDYLYFLNNLNPNPTSLKVIYNIQKSDDSITQYIETIAAETNSLYVINATLDILAEQSKVNKNDIERMSVKLYDQEDVSLTESITFIYRTSPPLAKTLFFLTTLGVWERLTCVGQIQEQREIDAPQSEYNNRQYEIYSHSFERIELNTGELLPGRKQYLSYQLAHTKAIMVQQPDGTYRGAIKTSKNFKQYDNQEAVQSLSFELRYLETEV